MKDEFVLFQTATQTADVASVLQEPADKFQNDVCLFTFIHFVNIRYGYNNIIFIAVDKR